MLIAAIVAIAAVVAIVSRYGARWWFRRANDLRYQRTPDGIVIGAEPIHLAHAGETAVLLLHGFGDTPQTLRGLAAVLHEHGFAVSVPLLPGHGRSLDAFVHSTSAEWLAEAEARLAELQEQHRHVAIVGLSMGGALAVMLAARHSEVRSMVLIAPYLSVPSRVRRLTRWRSVVGNLLPYFPALGDRSIHDEVARASNLAYGALNVSALTELVATVDAATEVLPQLQLPVLMLQSRRDNRIPVEAAERVFARLGSAAKEIVWLTGSGHILTVDYERDLVAQLTVDFLARTALSAHAAELT